MGTVERSDGYVRSLLVATVLSVAGIVAAQVTTVPAFLLDPALVESPADASSLGIVALMGLNFAGFVLVGAAYLWWTDRGWSYLDLRWPTGRGWLFVLVGIFGSIGYLFVVNVVATLFELESSENQVVQFIGDDPNVVLLMIVIVFAFNAPAEEFLFRNVIQKRLYAAFSRMGAVVATSVIFALIHIPSYALSATGVAPAGAIAVSLAVVFGGSLIFGTLYAKTDNLVVPIAAHAAFNAFQFGILYLLLRFAPDELENAMAVAVETALAAVPV
ncbi:CPBP family intramembrane glutamic endopeptidase [Salinilacihabitans rarus]|uniref:CPBP family intramembrane glutamic endopeptidase n=1 Tax=Salinilacihabitans rarus TaxID=2961596 RepID=UPI0020C9363F|nr:CPBP family intramembrane glutamic endopeptidase [Salinilacihabitans rarus]